MTLRARLVVLIAAIVAVVGGAGMLVVDRQRDALIERLDDELRSASSVFAPSIPIAVDELGAPAIDGTTGGGTEITGGVLGEASDPPLSDLYTAIVLADGEPISETVGQLLVDRPGLDGTGVANVDATTIMTAPGSQGEQQFRVLLSPRDDGTVAVIAKPLDPVDRAVGGLVRNLVVAGSVVVGLLLTLLWWVLHLGLRPISRLTEAATEASAGPGAPRVQLSNNRTEAGRLGAAFNEMLDQRDRADARLRRFVADASHELRTPLTSVEGYLELLASGRIAPDDLDEVVRRLRNESHRMRDLVEDLLLLAHLDEGRPWRRELVDLGALVRDLGTDAAAMHPDRRIDVVVDVAAAGGETNPAASTLVVGDELRLHQVIAGLLGNAVVHTPPSTHIELRVWAPEPGTAAVTVRDDGPGVDAATAATLFDRFTRGDSSRARAGGQGGFGLGLAIARSVVESHGGRLSLDTAPGAGCAFTMVLPAAAPSP